MKNLFFILFILMSTFSFSKNPKWLDGKWQGIGYEISNKTWKVELTKTGKNLTIQYPTLGCSGNWKIVSVNRKRIKLEETITDGADKCDQGCKVTLFKVDKTQISAVYTLLSYQKNAIAYVVLVKE